MVLMYRSPVPLDASHQNLLPAFTGLFALPGLLQVIWLGARPPRQRQCTIDLPIERWLRGTVIGLAGGLFAGFLPVISGGGWGQRGTMGAIQPPSAVGLHIGPDLQIRRPSEHAEGWGGRCRGDRATGRANCCMHASAPCTATYSWRPACLLLQAAHYSASADKQAGLLIHPFQIVHPTRCCDGCSGYASQLLLKRGTACPAAACECASRSAPVACATNRTQWRQWQQR